MLSDKRVFEIRERSIVSAGRLALTKEYATIHYGCESYDLDGPRMIVVHYTAFDTLETSWRFMAPDELSEIRDDIRKGGALNVGAHYMIDRTGDILRLIPDHIMARHTIGFNHVSLAIENVGRDQYHLTDDQVEADAWLIDLLVRIHPTIEYLVGHHEYADAGLPHYQLMLERAPSYGFTIKQDPGIPFMAKLRGVLASDYGITLKD